MAIRQDFGLFMLESALVLEGDWMPGSIQSGGEQNNYPSGDLPPDYSLERYEDPIANSPFKDRVRYFKEDIERRRTRTGNPASWTRSDLEAIARQIKDLNLPTTTRRKIAREQGIDLRALFKEHNVKVPIIVGCEDKLIKRCEAFACELLFLDEEQRKQLLGGLAGKLIASGQAERFYNKLLNKATNHYGLEKDQIACINDLLFCARQNKWFQGDTIKVAKALAEIICDVQPGILDDILKGTILERQSFADFKAKLEKAKEQDISRRMEEAAERSRNWNHARYHIVGSPVRGLPDEPAPIEEGNLVFAIFTLILLVALGFGSLTYWGNQEDTFTDTAKKQKNSIKLDESQPK